MLGLLLGPLTYFFSTLLFKCYVLVLAVYLALLSYEGLRVFVKDKSIKAGVYVTAGIALTHLVYGINFIIGIIKRPKLKLRGIDERTGNYLGG